MLLMFAWTMNRQADLLSPFSGLPLVASFIAQAKVNSHQNSGFAVKLP